MSLSDFMMANQIGFQVPTFPFLNKNIQTLGIYLEPGSQKKGYKDLLLWVWEEAKWDH